MGISFSYKSNEIDENCKGLKNNNTEVHSIYVYYIQYSLLFFIYPQNVLDVRNVRLS